jgi:hypothetical protein
MSSEDVERAACGKHRRTDAGQPAPDSRLHALLGLPPNEPSSSLKRAYETEMARATRLLDFQRAVELSRAFDELSASTRGSLFRGAERHRVPSYPDDLVPGDQAPLWASGPKAYRARARRPIVVRVVVWLVLVPICVAVGTAVMIHFRGLGDAAHQLPVPYPTTVRQPTGGTARPARSGAPGTAPRYVLPPDAPVDIGGEVEVLCQPGPGVAGYVFKSRPGAVVSCNNGAVPHMIG